MEQLGIAFDLRTQEAVEGLKIVVAELESLSRSVTTADGKVTGLEGNLTSLGRQLGLTGGSVSSAADDLNKLTTAAEQTSGAVAGTAQASQEATQPVDRLAGATQTAASDARQYALNLTQVNTQLNETSQNVTTNITQINTQNISLRNTTNNLADSVRNWIGAYAGMQAVLKVYDDIKQRIDDVLEAQGELVGAKLGFDVKIQGLVANLNLDSSPTGQIAATKLVDDLTKRVPATVQTAVDALSVANANSHDPTKPEGMDYAAVLAAFMAREKMDGNTAGNVVKVAQSRGLDTVQGLKKVIAEGDAVFAQTPTINRKDFWSGLAEGVLPEIPKGVDPAIGAAIYSAFAGLTTTSKGAADATKQAFTFAQGTTGKVRDFFAHQAARLGLTQPGNAADDPRAFLQADASEAGIAYRGDAGRLGDVDMKERLAYVHGMNRGRRLSAEKETEFARGLTNFDPAKARTELSTHSARGAMEIDSLEGQRSELTDKIQLALTKAAGKGKAAAEGAAYNNLSLDDRLQLVMNVVGGLDTTEKVNEFNEQVGGQWRRLDKVEMLRGKSARPYGGRDCGDAHRKPVRSRSERQNLCHR